MTKLPKPAGLSGLRTIDAGGPCRYYYSAPADAGPDSPVIVSVHGISLNAAEHMLRMRAVAAKLGAVVIAPWFDRAHFRGYQRLLCHDGQTRADLALIAMLDDAAGFLGIDASRIYLAGFSGGGQFAHRFAAFHADRVAACVTSAAGWYTFPDAERPYPQGTAPGSGPAGLALHPDARQVPMHVLVGSLDDRPETSLNMTKAIVEQQGAGRVARARRWVAAMQADRTRNGGAPVTLTVVENLGHDFSKAMDHHALDALIAARFGLHETKEKYLA